MSLCFHCGMKRKKRLSKTGLPLPQRGVKLVRKRKFEPQLETKSKVRVRSKYEQRCADFLYSNNISFKYEPLIILGSKQYRPDFYLPKYNLFLEICGYTHMPFYRDRTSHKKKLFEENNMKALFIYYNGKGSLEEILKHELNKFGVSFNL